MYKNIPNDHAFLRFVSKLEAQQTFCNVITQVRQCVDLQCSLLLFCCWYAQSGQGRLARADFQELNNAICLWHDKVTRAMLKLSEKIKDAADFSEIKDFAAAQVQWAENSELLILSDVLIKFSKNARSTSQKMTDAYKNIALYCKEQRIAITPTSSELFYQLMACVFPDVDLAETYTACQKTFFEENEISAKQEKMF